MSRNGFRFLDEISIHWIHGWKKVVRNLPSVVFNFLSKSEAAMNLARISQSDQTSLNSRLKDARLDDKFPTYSPEGGSEIERPWRRSRIDVNRQTAVPMPLSDECQSIRSFAAWNNNDDDGTSIAFPDGDTCPGKMKEEYRAWWLYKERGREWGEKLLCSPLFRIRSQAPLRGDSPDR